MESWHRGPAQGSMTPSLHCILALEDEMNIASKLSRRKFLASTGLLAASAMVPKSLALAQTQKIRVGLMLPYTGTYAQLGTAITNGFKLAVTERGGRLGGRELEYFTVDDEAEPAKAPENTNKL